MRNSEYLDNEQPEDKYISDMMFDEEDNPYRIVNGVKVIQLEEKIQHDIDLNLTTNRHRITGK